MLVADIERIEKVILPPRDLYIGSEDNLDVRCRLAEPQEIAARVEPYQHRGGRCRRGIATADDGRRFALEFASFNDVYQGVAGVLRGQPLMDGATLDLTSCPFRDPKSDEIRVGAARQAAYDSWRLKGISYHHEIRDNGTLVRPGLRLPQTGALHAVAAHWTLNKDPALVVMPTGTGKTEVMLATAVAAACDRVLVIVPTDPLRSQTAGKFATYGILDQIGTIDGIPYPVVGLLSSRPSPVHMDRLRLCNVVVTTMSSIGGADEHFMATFASLFSHVFFDEAHHVEAATWKRFSSCCGHAKVLMFTATPFREDGKPIRGKIIYNYPLSEAQAGGFFKPIRFVEVFEPRAIQADTEIAAAAVAQLREDLAEGFDHILLARASTIDAAIKIHDEIYRERYADLSPVLIHSRTTGRKKVLDAIKSGRHRIVVCVDMFGEGYDLPQLKVAALHSVHKSLGITLQFIGRFTRSGGNVGPATFVANTAEDGVPEALEGLYFEDSDWNQILRDMSYDAIDPQARLSELVDSLRPAAQEEEDLDISLIALKPKISANVYRAEGFRPERFGRAFRPAQTIHQPHIGDDGNMLVLIVNEKEGIDWTDSKDIRTDRWDLYLAYFDEERSLLFINTSKDGGAYRLAEAISVDPVPIRDEDVFRAFSSLKRIVLHSVGLSSANRNVRYQMFAGLDVRNAITPADQQSRRKSNIMGVGYNDGLRESVGCSRKGKIWSLQSGSLAVWKAWCNELGAKLTNLEAPADAFLRYTLIPEQMTAFPDTQALLVDWPDQMFEMANFKFQLQSGGNQYDFHDCEVTLAEWGQRDSFAFAIEGERGFRIDLRLRLLTDEGGETTFRVEHEGETDGEIVAFGQRKSVAEFFTDDPPLVRLADGSQIAGDIILKPREELQETYERDLMTTFAWGDVDLTMESRWKDGVFRPRSIQQRFIEHLAEGDYTFIVDDDDAGESADVVAIEETAQTIVVHLWHCKYTQAEAGLRAGDLYEVCGQAQKSVKWTWSLNTLIKHLTDRETNKLRGRPTRFVRGSVAELATLRKSSRRRFVEFRVGIVQPGVRKVGIPNEHLAILGATSNFLQVVTGHPLRTICS